MRLLHIVPDQKFIDDAYTAFEEAAPGRNDFIVIGAAKAVRINRFEPQLLSLPELLGPDFPSRVARYDCLFIHYLNREARVAVDRCPAGTLLVWLGWGADYYHLIEDRRALLLPLTRSVYDRLQVRPKARLRAAVLYASRLLRGLGRPREVIAELRVRRRAAELGPGRPGELALLNRFALFAPVLYEDHQRVAASTPGFRPEFASWNYGVRDGLEEMRDSIESFGRNVLVGNSATFENNHLEALTMLRDAMSGDTQAICPLSYGRADYARSVARRGSEILGTRFRPLLEFLPI
ncbi:MAG TPA: hypothetical protein VHL59_04890, partial [Thermoanaerobaculia bacterium]|nr:hypothetical protein [Thermoanaerobaculia bacterium]